MTENALKCKYNGGNVPLGYYIDDELHYQIDTTISPFILETFQKYNDGYKLKEIVTWLNDSGVQTTRKYPVSIDTVNRILKNRNYVGDYHYDKHIIPGGVPAIVPPDLFPQVQEKLAKNKKAPARAKAIEENYLLTTKLYCGLCSAYMIGESGHSSTGKVHFYYKCATAKKNKSCKKKTVKKSWIEDIVISQAMKLLADDKIMDKIADAILKLQTQENITLPMLRKQLAETERGIVNMLNAIQQGILNQSTKKRLDDLEEAKSNIEVKILQEEMEKPLLSREQILFWLHKFRGVDTSKQEQRQLLVDTFVNAVYLYDDKIIFTFNSREDAKTITIKEVEETFRSDFTAGGSPGISPRYMKNQ
jgi:transposase-like protein